MIASRGMHIRNTACISLNCKDIRITDINELYKIANPVMELIKWTLKR